MLNPPTASLQILATAWLALLVSADPVAAASAETWNACSYKRDIDACTRIMNDRSEPPAKRAEAQVARGNHRSALGEFAAAIEDYAAALALDSTNEDARYQRALANHALGDWAAMIPDLTTMLEANPNDAEAAFLLSGAYAGQGLNERAIDAIGAAIASDPLEPDYWISRGSLCQAQGNIDGAQIDFSTAVRINPTVGAPFSHRARAFLARGEINRAIADYDRAIAFTEQDAQLYRERAAAHRTAGKIDLALADFDKAIALDATDNLALLERGLLRAAQSEFAAALADLDLAIKIDADNAALFSARAVIHAAKGDFERALADHSRAIELAPNDLWRYAQRAWTYLKADKAAQGLADAERAVTQKPERAAAFSTRGHIHEAIGRKTEAIADFRKALALLPTFREAHAALVRLGQRTPALPAPRESTTPPAPPLNELAWLTPHLTETRATLTLYPANELLFVRSGPAYGFAAMTILSGQKTVNVVATVKYKTRSGCGIDTESAQLTWYKLELPDGSEGFVNERNAVDTSPNRAVEAQERPRGAVVPSLAPDGPELFETRAASYELANILGLKEANYARALEMNPGLRSAISRDASTFNLRADDLRVAGELEHAIAYSRIAILLGPSPSDVLGHPGVVGHQIIAGLYLEMGRHAAALAEINEALRIKPDYSRSYEQRGQLYEVMGRRAEAIADYRRALQLGFTILELYDVVAGLQRLGVDLAEIVGLRPKIPDELNGRCWQLATANRELEQALTNCSASLQLRPGDANTLDSRGFVYLRLGRLSEAIVDYTAALKINPKAAHSLFGRGIARLRRGESAAGKADIAAANRMNSKVASEFKGYGIVP